MINRLVLTRSRYTHYTWLVLDRNNNHISKKIQDLSMMLFTPWNDYYSIIPCIYVSDSNRVCFLCMVTVKEILLYICYFMVSEQNSVIHIKHWTNTIIHVWSGQFTENWPGVHSDMASHLRHVSRVSVMVHASWLGPLHWLFKQHNPLALRFIEESYIS